MMNIFIVIDNECQNQNHIQQSQSMKSQLFIDSIRLMFSNLETQTIKTLTNRSPISNKIEDFSLNILQFKSNLYQNLQLLFSQYKSNEPAILMKKQYESQSLKLKKLQLHAFLKKKIKKIQKQSMISSFVDNSFHSNSNFNVSVTEDPTITKLKKSIMLIEKDLHIQDEFEGYEDDVSSVVHRSIASMSASRFHTQIDLSNSSISMDEQKVLPQNLQSNIQTPKNIQSKLNEEQKKTAMTKQAVTKNPVKKKKVIVSNMTANKGGMFQNLIQESLETYTKSNKF